MPEEQEGEQETTQEPGVSAGAGEGVEGQGAEMQVISGFGNIFTPEGVMMLMIAAIIDIIDAFILSIIIVDIIAIIIIGFWIYLRSGQVKATRGAVQRISGAAKRLRWLRPLMGIIEFIPIVGVLPCWTLLVYFELQA